MSESIFNQYKIKQGGKGNSGAKGIGGDSTEISIYESGNSFGIITKTGVSSKMSPLLSSLNIEEGDGDTLTYDRDNKKLKTMKSAIASESTKGQIQIANDNDVIALNDTKAITPKILNASVTKDTQKNILNAMMFNRANRRGNVNAFVESQSQLQYLTPPEDGYTVLCKVDRAIATWNNGSWDIQAIQNLESWNEWYILQSIDNALIYVDTFTGVDPIPVDVNIEDIDVENITIDDWNSNYLGKTIGIQSAVGLRKLAILTTVRQLVTVGTNFTQKADIDLDDLGIVDETNWDITIGEYQSASDSHIAFQGNYNGNGYSISNLKINKQLQGQGLFSTCYGSTLENIIILNSLINSTNLTGILCAYANSGCNIKNCYTTGEMNINISKVTSPEISLQGGLIGYCGNLSTIDNCHSNIIITTLEEGELEGLIYTGGLVGQSSNSTIINCSSQGVITPVSSDVGGFIGQVINNSSIENCWSTVDITVYNSTSVRRIGGFIGETTGSTITDCYCTGSVNTINSTISIAYTGGFAGYAIGNTLFTGCYATGNISGKQIYTGGFIGYAKSPTRAINCYATGNISGISGNNFGGFCGMYFMSSGQNIDIFVNCYATGNVSASVTNMIAGGFIARWYMDTGSSNATSGKINGCYSTGTVNGIHHTGGFVGASRNNIYNCWTTSKVNGSNTKYAGAFAGSRFQGIFNGNMYDKTINAGMKAVGDGLTSPTPSQIQDTIIAVPAPPEPPNPIVPNPPVLPPTEVGSWEWFLSGTTFIQGGTGTYKPPYILGLQDKMVKEVKPNWDNSNIEYEEVTLDWTILNIPPNGNLIKYVLKKGSSIINNPRELTQLQLDNYLNDGYDVYYFFYATEIPNLPFLTDEWIKDSLSMAFCGNTDEVQYMRTESPIIRIRHGDNYKLTEYDFYWNDSRAEHYNISNKRMSQAYINGRTPSLTPLANGKYSLQQLASLRGEALPDSTSEYEYILATKPVDYIPKDNVPKYGEYICSINPSEISYSLKDSDGINIIPTDISISNFSSSKTGNHSLVFKHSINNDIVFTLNQNVNTLDVGQVTFRITFQFFINEKKYIHSELIDLICFRDDRLEVNYADTNSIKCGVYTAYRANTDGELILEISKDGDNQGNTLYLGDSTSTLEIFNDIMVDYDGEWWDLWGLIPTAVNVVRRCVVPIKKDTVFRMYGIGTDYLYFKPYINMGRGAITAVT